MEFHRSCPILVYLTIHLEITISDVIFYRSIGNKKLKNHNEIELGKICLYAKLKIFAFKIGRRISGVA